MAEWIIDEETEDGWYVTAGDRVYLRCENKDDAEKLAKLLIDMNITVEQA